MLPDRPDDAGTVVTRLVSGLGPLAIRPRTDVHHPSLRQRDYAKLTPALELAAREIGKLSNMSRLSTMQPRGIAGTSVAWHSEPT